MGTWWAWGMLLSGCIGLALGVVALVRRRTSQYPVAPRVALGQILMGAGLGFDGVPRIAGWSSGAGASAAGWGAAAVLLGVALQVRGETLRRCRRTAKSR